MYFHGTNILLVGAGSDVVFVGAGSDVVFVGAGSEPAPTDDPLGSFGYMHGFFLKIHYF
ncbi:MAG: hypothetical protein HQ542_12550 [Bacteroidia bacterium]|nr:hypothetical protein [Bacteroidia bacterium]